MADSHPRICGVGAERDRSAVELVSELCERRVCGQESAEQAGDKSLSLGEGVGEVVCRDRVHL
jgi:hypothetical protein